MSITTKEEKGNGKTMAYWDRGCNRDDILRHFCYLGEAPLVYRVVYVVLFVGLLYAAMRSKPNTDKGSHDSNNHPLHALIDKASDKSSGSTTNG